VDNAEDVKERVSEALRTSLTDLARVEDMEVIFTQASQATDLTTELLLTLRGTTVRI